MDKFVQWLQQLQLESFIEIVITVAASLLCITVHESCHGLVAWWLGDDTAKQQGRISLNPTRHVDPMGLVMMAIARFGWAKAVPVNMNRFRNPKLGMAVTALAGPLSNVVLLLLAMIFRAILLVLYLSSGSLGLYYLVLFLEYTAILSAGLAVFNLFPISPLDGSKIVFALLPSRYYQVLMRVERYGMLFLAALLLLGVLDSPLNFLRDALLGAVDYVTNPIFSFFASRML